MGDVAVMHSKSLHYDFKDMKHITETNMYFPESSTDCVPGEEPRDHENISDLREKGYMQYGRCQIRGPCCNENFDCHHCHNEVKNNISIDHKHRHDIPRHQVKQVICSLCGTEQEMSLDFLQYHCVLYSSLVVWILWNDCGKTSYVQFHVLAQKCSNCKSYNPRKTRG